MRPRSRGPFYIVSYFIIWVTTSWKYSMFEIIAQLRNSMFYHDEKKALYFFLNMKAMFPMNNYYKKKYRLSREIGILVHFSNFFEIGKSYCEYVPRK